MNSIWRLCVTGVVAGMLGVLAQSPVSAYAETPGVGWAVAAGNYPTYLEPGGHGLLHVEVLNIGAADSQGTVTVTDHLPPGMTAREPEPDVEGAGELEEKRDGLEPIIRHEAWLCTGNGSGPAPKVAGATVITCTNDSTRLPTLSGGGGLPTEDIPEGVNGSNPTLPIIGIAVDAPSSPAISANEVQVEGGGASAATTMTDLVTVSATDPSFSIHDWDSWFSKASGKFDNQAGSHPYEWTSTFDLATLFSKRSLGLVQAGGEERNILVNLPPGLIANPRAVPQCPRYLFNAEECPNASVVGVLNTRFAELRGLGFAVFNIAPPPGQPAQLGFTLGGIKTFFNASIRTGTDYGVDTHVDNIPQRGVAGSILTLWGVPGDPTHDRWRDGVIGGCSPGKVEEGRCRPLSEPRELKPFLTLPASCAGPQLFPISANTWPDPDVTSATMVESHDAEGNPVGFLGCNALPFTPTISAKPTTNVADAPSGLEFDLHFPLAGLEDPEAEVSEADLEDARVTLPKGIVVNPSSANGLGVCGPAQIGLTSAIEASPLTTTPGPAECPDDSKIGSVEVDSPLLAEHNELGEATTVRPLRGSVYLATPMDNPFKSLLAIYITVDDPETGTVVKLAGHVEADPATGRLVTRVEESPQLPFEDFHLNFFGGAHAALRTPQTCGTYSTASEMTPWSSPEGADAAPADSFAISRSSSGGPCPASEAQLPNKPSFTAGTIAPKAGAYSPFVLRLARQDGSQELQGIDTTLPGGLTGKLAGISECSDAQIAQAESRSGIGQGALEQSDPSCPASSLVGKVTVGAGAGPSPYYTSGNAYLAGPYKGAPLSFEIITPAVAGPYDLGSVAVRTALYVDPETAQIHAVSDPIPHILHGIPLDVRSIELSLSRSQFTINPTSCAKKAILGTATSILGQATPLTSPFQVGDCAKLGFAPKLSLRLKGSTKRGGAPALKATLTYPQGSYANIAKASVALPHSEFLDNAHIQTVCTRVQLAQNACPKGSVYGFARAYTPLLDKPLEGPVYLGTGYGHELPDLLADLNGQIHVILNGTVDSVHGGIRNRFEVVPDAPVSKFTLEMQGGKKGLLENSTNICAGTHRATVKFTGQNGKVLETSPPLVAAGCKGKAKKHSKGKKKHHGYGAG